MPPRQIWLFKFGCWAAIVTAIAHLLAHIALPPTPVNDTERQLLDLAVNYRFAFPGGSERALMDMLNGLSLAFALFFAALGAIGLVVARRGQDDALLMYGVAQSAAVASAVMLAISLAYFFIVPNLFIAVVAVCFGVAAVRAPGAGAEQRPGDSEG
jgi:hypothetical protein